jgi:hypothetical protein
MHDMMLTTVGKFTGRYIVEKKKYLFSATKMILVINNEEIQLYPISKYPG